VGSVTRNDELVSGLSFRLGRSTNQRSTATFAAVTLSAGVLFGLVLGLALVLAVGLTTLLIIAAVSLTITAALAVTGAVYLHRSHTRRRFTELLEQETERRQLDEAFRLGMRGVRSSELPGGSSIVTEVSL
jgi:Flp pilus assembly protein TadB